MTPPTRTVALVGRQNAGKTSVLMHLTGTLQKPVNFPGSSVERVEAHVPDPKTPLGVKGIGEPAITPTAPAIINAIYDAVGVRITRLPATPERVMEALRNKRAIPVERSERV